ncbi:hypothetical protein A2881_00690 [Candidatus Peribacteria bacterium RIFCSPHIGHO2_01_FULL_55_13]|nr:MAG: hypothetical protein A2881_00690 [Candidatus Peribacteria bacterium RIFCSPHIGHO2_01_FULL_55_13]
MSTSNTPISDTEGDQFSALVQRTLDEYHSTGGVPFSIDSDPEVARMIQGTDSKDCVTLSMEARRLADEIMNSDLVLEQRARLAMALHNITHKAEHRRWKEKLS